MRIAIVNDMKLTIELLRRVIGKVPDCEIIWTAGDGIEAVEKCAADTPDILIMDMMMPRMNGVEATRRIMQNSPCAILIVTASVAGNSTLVCDALGEGALDAINTPSMLVMGDDEHSNELLKKMSILRKLIGSSVANARKTMTPQKIVSADAATVLVAIGSSTGGPKAVADLLAMIPENINAAFVVIQHIDRQFAAGLASWLTHSSKLKIKIAEPGDSPQRGMVLLAGTNDHMIMRSDGTVEYTVHPESNPYRPSVDVFFQSLEKNWKEKGIAVLLTGIGRDGAEGLLTLRKSGWHTFAQNRESCVVYGMPKAAAELKAADEVLSPDLIGKKIAEII